MPKIVEDEHIYAVAMQMVMERGYMGATTKQIAEAANISEVTLFRKYESKAGLIKQAIASRASKIDFATAAQYSGDIEADLTRVVKMYQTATAVEGNFFYTLLLEIPRHPELADMIDTPISMISAIGDLLTRYQDDGVLQRENPFHAVAALLGPLIVTNMIRGATQRVPLPEVDLAVHVAGFIHGRVS